MNGIGAIFTIGGCMGVGTIDLSYPNMTTNGYISEHGEITDNMIYNLWMGNGIEITARFFGLTIDVVADVILKRFDKDIKSKGAVK